MSNNSRSLSLFCVYFFMLLLIISCASNDINDIHINPTFSAYEATSNSESNQDQPSPTKVAIESVSIHNESKTLDFTLYDNSSSLISLNTLIEQNRFVVLVFYRGFF